MGQRRQRRSLPNGKAVTDRSRRVWRDPRDGTTWTIRAYWSRDMKMMAWIVFESDRKSYRMWWASWIGNRKLSQIAECELQSLLDEARSH